MTTRENQETDLARKAIAHNTIYSLFYPAVLGSMIAGLVFALTENQVEATEFRFPFALFILLYFSSQHIVNNTSYSKENYSVIIFLLDLIEIILMMGIFFLLGIFKFDYAVNQEGHEQLAWYCIYSALIASLAIPMVCHGLSKAVCEPSKKVHMVLLLLAILVLFCGYFSTQSFIVLSLLGAIYFTYIAGCVLKTNFMYKALNRLDKALG